MPKKTSLLAAALLAGTCITSVSNAQVVPPLRFGIYGGLNINMLSPSLQAWRGSPLLDPVLQPFVNDTTRFTSGGTGMGANLGLIVGIPLSTDIHLSARLGYSAMSGSTSVEQRSPITTTTNEASLFMSTLEIAPVVEFYSLFKGVSLHPLVGLEFGIPLAATITQSVQGVQQNTRTENFTLANGDDVPSQSVRAALLIGAGYTIPIGGQWYLQPELTYRLPLTNISSDARFSPTTFSQIRVGINIFFGFTSAQTAEPSKRGMTASIDRVTAYDKDGREVAVSQLNVEDVRYNEMFPLVPYVFAQENSVPDASSQNTEVMTETGSFAPEALPLDAIEVNRNLLNIIGSRMKALPHATLMITGTTDGKGELKAKGLAENRAAWAKEYITRAFGIDPQRITVRSTTVPTKPSASTDPDGVAENRRIEFSSNVPDVLAPVIITAENQRISSPDVVTFHPSVTGADSLASWTLSITQAGRLLRELEGKGSPSRVTWPIKPNELSAEQVPVDYEFVARSTEGDSAYAIGSVPVEYVSSIRKRTENLPDRTIDKYSLILFDFDKASLTEDNQRILELTVLPNIASTSKVNIIGYTDRIGNDVYNQKLSRERAETVRVFLQTRAKDARYSINGLGESSEIFPNDLAVGRQLSRTVQVIVETPRR